MNLPDKSVDPEVEIKPLVPHPGGTRFMIYIHPPTSDEEEWSQEKVDVALEKWRELAPGLGETLERKDPEMHTTDTVDYIVVLSGEADLELDDQATVRLEPGDCVVQRGTRHAWRNTSSAPFVVAAVLVGAQRNA